jgi:hypothetical protein
MNLLTEFINELEELIDENPLSQDYIILWEVVRLQESIKKDDEFRPEDHEAHPTLSDFFYGPTDYTTDYKVSKETINLLFSLAPLGSNSSQVVARFLTLVSQIS